jgi:rhodanese-related sulfurtransferase
MPDTSPEFRLPSISAEAALVRLAEGAALVDLRKPPARTADGRTIRGAQVRDPFTFTPEDALFSDDRPVVTFCVHGRNRTG